MTFNAHRNNLKGLRIVWVVILTCLFIALALKGFCWGNFARGNSMTNGITSFDFFRKTVTVSGIPVFPATFTFFGLVVSLSDNLTFFALQVSFISSLAFSALFVFFLSYFALAALAESSTGCSAFFTLAITFCAIFTVAFKTTFPIKSFKKLRNGLYFFAYRASFCYDRFRHGFFLVKKLRLEPITAQTVVGSFYINIFRGDCKC